MTQSPESSRSQGRPAHHLTAESGWVNDPHGLTYHAGRYHLFYQHVPRATRWRPDCSWGHATSPDLLSWTEHEPALAPGDGDLGCWSGSLCTPPDEPAVIFYTSVNEPHVELGAIRSARPRDDDWTTWEKGPVVALPPPGHDLSAFRDPAVFRDGSLWRMLVGAGYADGRAAVLSYSSADLHDWTFDGVAAERHPNEQQPISTGEVWECPQLIPLGDRHALVVSVCSAGTAQYVAAATGRYQEGRFTAERWTRLSYGDPGHYAACAFTDTAGQPGLIFWIRGAGDEAAGWMGALSIPYRVAMADGSLTLTPHLHIRGALSSPGQVLGLDWTPTSDNPEDRLSITTASGQAVATLRAANGNVTVETPDAAARLPLGRGSVQVLADGVVLEVCTGAAVAGLPIAAAASHCVTSEATDVVSWPAHRRRYSSRS